MRSSFLLLRGGVFFDQHLAGGEGCLCKPEEKLMLISFENLSKVYVTGSQVMRRSCQNNHSLKYKPSTTCSIIPLSQKTRLLQIPARVNSFSQLSSVQLLLYLTCLGFLNICKFRNNPTKLPIKVIRKMLMRLI